MATKITHQIIRQAIMTPMGFAHKIECTCGRKITLTNSLKIAEQKAQNHLNVARADGETGRSGQVYTGDGRARRGAQAGI